MYLSTSGTSCRKVLVDGILKLCSSMFNTQLIYVTLVGPLPTHQMYLQLILSVTTGSHILIIL